MNILYLISCFGHGRGGHFYSLRTTAEEMQKVAGVTVVSIGTSESPVFAKMDNYYPIKTKLPTPMEIGQLLGIIRKHKIDVIHSFDILSYFFARVASVLTGKPVLHTKCGGPPPKRYYPKVRDLVLYSIEDVNYFKDSEKHRKTNLYHIPNRVPVIQPDMGAIIEIKKYLRDDAIVFLRIVRLSEFYKQNILSCIKLMKYLREDGFDAQLLLIGSVQDKGVYEEISSHADDDIVLVTEDKYTVNASKLISVADYVIGTGRGAMEAAMQGKVLLSPVQGVPIPVIVTPKNINTFLDFNFSDRTVLYDNSHEEVYAEIKKIMNDSDHREKNLRYIQKFAEQKFSISSVKSRYLEIYSTCKKCDLNFVDILMNYYLTAKIFYVKNKQYSK